jgi:Uri superfamily endonuclease
LEITYQDEQFCCWGSGSQGGSYVLRLVVSQAQAVRFGRFQNGQPIIVPQPIRQKMLALFPKIGLGPTLLHPPSGKKLRWHVDFLLDEPGVALTAVYFIRENLPEGSSQKWVPDTNLREGGARILETAVARWLLSFPEVRPLVPGLGSTDDPGGTHLLAVTAVPTWWIALPNYLTHFLRDNAV